MFHIMCCINDAYVQHCVVMLASLFDNNKSSNFCIHVFSFSLNTESITILRSFVEQNSQNIEIKIIAKPNVEFPNINGHYISADTYIRLFVPETLDKSIDKILYMDVDMVVIGDISDIFKVDLGNNLLAAIMDTPKKNRNERLGIPQEYGYFNAGLLMINVQKWKELGLTSKCIQFITEHSSLIRQHDQDVLNALAFNMWQRIPFKWNMLNSFFYTPPFIASEYIKEMEECYKDVRIAHYSGAVKPWHTWCRHPYYSMYYKYLAKTPFKDFKPTLKVQWNSYKFPKNVMAILGISSILGKFLNRKYLNKSNNNHEQ